MDADHLPADDENAYESLTEAHGGEDRWAFGTGFADPLLGVDLSLPADADAGSIAAQCLSLGDDALVLSQRLSQWCSNAPELEDEMALANIALDLLGQSRLLLTRAAALDPGLRPVTAPRHVPDEDALAYFRGADEFRCTPLMVLDDGGDFAVMIARLFLATSWRLALLDDARCAADPVLAAIAAKGIVEASYHRDYAAAWVLRLGDGTELSHRRMRTAVDAVWPYAAELLAGVDASVRSGVDQVLTEATLGRPAQSVAAQLAPEILEAVLGELQCVARTNPEASW